MNAMIFHRVAKPLPLSCLLHVMCFLLLAMLWHGDSWQAGQEKQETVIEVEMTAEEMHKVQELRQAVPSKPHELSGGAVYSSVSQQAAAGAQALLAAEEAASAGDGAVAAGRGNGELSHGGSSFAAGMEGNGTGDAPAGDDNISTGNSPAAVSQQVEAQESIADIASRFAARVEANKKYPYMAVRQGQHGVVTAYAVLAADGSLLDYGLSGSSGYESLDRAALKAVQSSCPFSHGAGHSITITVPVHFELN